MSLEAKPQVLTVEETRFFEGMRLDILSASPDRTPGERMSRSKGASIEFDEYREYVQGDDLRYLDWNVFGRLNQTVIKTFRDEQQLPITIYLDGSASMQFGSPTKLKFATKLAFGLCISLLKSGDMASIVWLGRNKFQKFTLKHRSQLVQLNEFLTPLSTAGTTENRRLIQDLDTCMAQSSKKGLAIVITDGLDPEFPNAVKRIAGRGPQPYVLQVLSPEELHPNLEGDLELIDAETGESVELTATAEVMNSYHQALNHLQDQIRAICVKTGGKYVTVASDADLLESCKSSLVRQGWFRT